MIIGKISEYSVHTAQDGQLLAISQDAYRYACHVCHNEFLARPGQCCPKCGTIIPPGSLAHKDGE